MKLSGYMSFTLLGIVTVSLINSFGGTVLKLSNKRSNITLWKKYDINISLDIAKMLQKWQNMQKILISQKQC